MSTTQLLSYTGDVTGSGTITDLGNTSIATTIGSGTVDNVCYQVLLQIVNLQIQV